MYTHMFLSVFLYTLATSKEEWLTTKISLLIDHLRESNIVSLSVNTGSVDIFLLYPVELQPYSQKPLRGLRILLNLIGTHQGASMVKRGTMCRNMNREFDAYSYHRLQILFISRKVLQKIRFFARGCYLMRIPPFSN